MTIRAAGGTILQICFQVEKRGYMTRMRNQVVRYAFTALAAAGLALAQVGGGGTIQGTITDGSGAIVPNAEVTATNIATGVTTTRKTTESGLFVLSPLQAGEYKVTISAQG